MISLLDRWASRPLAYVAAVAALLVLFTAMRGVFIGADAPQDCTVSAAIYTDEGFKTLDSRNDALIGKPHWSPEDEYEAWQSRSPLTASLFEFLFKRYGVSFETIRYPSVAYGLLTMIVLVLFMHRQFGRRAALVGLVLFGTNYFMAMSNRLGFYESHLIFYITLALWGFAEALRPIDGDRKAPNTAQRLLWLALGLGALAASFYVKRSFFIIGAAVIPAIAMALLRRRGAEARTINRSLAVFLAALAALYAVLAHIGTIKYLMVFFLNVITVKGQTLSEFFPIVIFDPLPSMLSKAFYLEAVFLHPVTFALGAVFSLFVLYRYAVEREGSTLELFLSCWFVLGFLILTLMNYSPARYYLLVVLPMIILAARLLADFPGHALATYLRGKKPFPHNVLFWTFSGMLTIYTGVVAVVQILPFTLRRWLVNERLYPAFNGGDIMTVIPIIAAVAAVEIALAALVIAKRGVLVRWIELPRFAAVILAVIVGMQCFQYGKWFFSHEYRLRDLSRELGRELPPDAVIVGSWSAGLTIENRLRPLVMQSYVPYNHDLAKRLIKNEEITVYEGEGSAIREVKRKDIPLYITVCRHVIFERTIACIYQDYLVPQNLVKKVELGYFTVEVYRVDRGIRYERTYLDCAKKYFTF